MALSRGLYRKSCSTLESCLGAHRKCPAIQPPPHPCPVLSATWSTSIVRSRLGGRPAQPSRASQGEDRKGQTPDASARRDGRADEGVRGWADLIDRLVRALHGHQRSRHWHPWPQRSNRTAKDAEHHRIVAHEVTNGGPGRDQLRACTCKLRRVIKVLGTGPPVAAMKLHGANSPRSPRLDVSTIGHDDRSVSGLRGHN